MYHQQYNFSEKTVDCYFNANFSLLENFVSKQNSVIITDENIASLHHNKFNGWKKVVLKAGEQHKQQSTVNNVIDQLIKLQIDRSSFIIGVGGGVITDIAGYAASVYMRGIKFGYVPTSILAMVDASIGGKNGVDVGMYKNLVGVIKHPEFLLYDYSFLKTLPVGEWINGFAEIIKHACIQDAAMFEMLEKNSPEEYINTPDKIADLVKRNVDLKYKVVSKDEHEQGERKLLNFGHTIGHAIENLYHLSHGNAVSIGMVAACKISREINNFSSQASVIRLLEKYNLPVEFNFDSEKIWDILLMDKKRTGDEMNFILLNTIGDGVVRSIPLHQLKKLITQL